MLASQLRLCKLTSEDGRVVYNLERSVAENNIAPGTTVRSDGEPIFDRLHFQRPDGKRFEIAGRDLLQRTVSSIIEVEIKPKLTNIDDAKTEVDLYIGCIRMEPHRTLFNYNLEYGETIKVKTTTTVTV